MRCRGAVFCDGGGNSSEDAQTGSAWSRASLRRGRGSGRQGDDACIWGERHRGRAGHGMHSGRIGDEGGAAAVAVAVAAMAAATQQCSINRANKQGQQTNNSQAAVDRRRTVDLPACLRGTPTTTNHEHGDPLLPVGHPHTTPQGDLRRHYRTCTSGVVPNDYSQPGRAKMYIHPSISIYIYIGGSGAA